MKTRIEALFLLPVMVVGFSLMQASHAEAQVYKILHSFTALNDYTNSDGARPQGALTLSGTTLYGTAQRGGSSSHGTVFKVNTDGTGFTVLKHFNKDDGSFPQGGLALSGSTLYGTTYYGGRSGQGTVFKCNTDGSAFTVLKNFGFQGSDGANPQANLTLVGSTLYGTTHIGGKWNRGTVFKVNTDGTSCTVLKNFNEGDGVEPCEGLMLAGSTLYGTTELRSEHGTLAAFKVDTDGTGFKVLKTFKSGVGAHFGRGGLALSGSVLYGTVAGGGNSRDEQLFKVNTDGTGFAVLKNFNSYQDSVRSLGGGLALSDSTIYGTALGGGMFDDGIVFKVNTDGTGFTVLRHLGGAGTEINGGLTLSGSTLYGTAAGGRGNPTDPYGNGVIFSLTIESPVTH